MTLTPFAFSKFKISKFFRLQNQMHIYIIFRETTQNKNKKEVTRE
jgi:hypothetical protein